MSKRLFRKKTQTKLLMITILNHKIKLKNNPTSKIQRKKIKQQIKNKMLIKHKLNQDNKELNRLRR
jgi:hypothetical protein